MKDDMGWTQTLTTILAVVVVTATFWRDLRQRIDRVEDRLGERLDRVEAKVGELAERIAHLEGRREV